MSPNISPLSPLQPLINVFRGFRGQVVIVAAFILAVFWHGFWAGAPRSDQVGYLHQVSQYSTLHDVLQHAPNWNRTHSAGDSALYRPVLYLLLGLEYACFGYDFGMWQAFAITLHILVAVVLLGTLWKTPLKGTFWPVSITCLFAGSLLGSELVIWNHITGYVLFATLTSISLYGLVIYFETERFTFLAFSLSAAALAVFTYELAIAYCGLAGFALFWASRSGRRLDEQTGSQWWRNALAGLFFLSLPGLYLVLSLAGYRATAGIRGGSGVSSTLITHVAEGLQYTILQLAYWMNGLIFPAAFRIAADARASLIEINRGWGIAHLLNYAGVVLIGGGTLIGLRRVKGIRWQGWARAAFSLAFVLAYSGVIAFGRSIDRGLAYTLNIHLYYSYIPVLVLCLGFVLLILDFREPAPAESRLIRVAEGLGLRLVGAGLTILICLNGWYTYQLCKEYRYKYSAPRFALLRRIISWRNGEGAEANRFFRIPADCAAMNDRLPWFPPHVRRGSRAQWTGPFSLADALFPEKSFKLNEHWLRNASVHVTDIPCPVIGVWNPHFLAGRWETDPARTAAHIEVHQASLYLTNEHGEQASGILQNGRIATSWGVEGGLATDGNTIVWRNGTLWFRSDPLDTSEVTDHALGTPDYPVVSSSQPGYEKENLTDGTDRAWGSATGDAETYAAIRFHSPREGRRLRIRAFSPAGKAHLRDFRVIVADGDGGRDAWRVVRAKLVEETEFHDKVTVGPLPDGQWITVDIDPTDRNAGLHRYWGFGCFSTTRGDNRNYLGAGGDGVYVREFEIVP